MQAFFGCALERLLKAPFICGSGSRADNAAVHASRSISRVDAAGPLPWGRCAQGVALALLVALLVPPAWGHDRRDHELARAAVQSGEALPLSTLLERLQRTHPGQVLELELEREGGRWIYEVKLLQTGGQLLKLELDARTAEILQVRQRGGHKSRVPGEPAP